jgi:hypothetical protein
MGRVNDTISNVNSAVRNLLLLVLIGGAGVGGYKAYDLYNKPKVELAEKNRLLAEKDTQLGAALKDLTTEKNLNADLTVKNKDLSDKYDRLQVAMKLLQVQHRMARLTVLDQREVPSLIPATPTTGNEVGASRPNVITKIEFVDINDEGKEIGKPKIFDIKGDMIYVDYLTVNFEDKYIASRALNHETSIALFQRIFGEHQEPAKGFQLDTVGTQPTAYSRGTPMSKFEKDIWDDFWLIANDNKRAQELGIDAIQGKAVAIRAMPGTSYEIKLRSTGDITIRPIEPKKAPPAAEAKNGK